MNLVPWLAANECSTIWLSLMAWTDSYGHGRTFGYLRLCFIFNSSIHNPFFEVRQVFVTTQRWIRRLLQTYEKHRGESQTADEKTKYENCDRTHFGSPLPERIRLPRERMDGTQIPTKRPSSRWPLNQSETENRNDKKAAARKM